MEATKLEGNVFDKHLTKNVLNHDSALLEEHPNLAHKDCEVLVYDVLGFQSALLDLEVK